MITAARLWGAAQALCQNSDLAISSPLTEKIIARVRSRLGSAFVHTLAEGRTMTPEQVLASCEQDLSLLPRALEDAPASRTRSTGATALSVREREVVRLVAQGLTDAQIAAQLIISPRTVTTHLTSIYNKLGVNSRTAAAHLATQKQMI